MVFSTATNDRQLLFYTALLFLSGALLHVGLSQPTRAQIRDEQKVSDTEGASNSLRLEAGANFGSAATRLAAPGTVAAIGTFRMDDGGPNRGAVWIVGLASDGTTTSVQKISSTAGNFSGPLDNNDRFGGAVASLGDLDGDGYPSLAVGADAGLDNTDPGTVWILELSFDRNVQSEQIITSGRGGFDGSLGGTDKFGSGLANLGDIDDDGKTNLAVGARYDPGNGRGSVWILDLNDDGTVADEQKITPNTGGFEASLDANDKFGNALSSLGDLDGNGTVELAVGANGDGDGAIWILSLNEDGTVADEQKISASAGGFGGNKLGGAIAATQDLNSDGVNELLNGVGGSDHAWILYLNSDGTVTDEEKIAAGQGGFDGSVTDGDSFGSAIAPLGDVDGDGTLDLLVGAKHTDDGGTDYGAVWTLFGERYPLPVELAQFDAQSNGDTVQLSWETASETNNSGFEIQRRVDASWKPIGFVESNLPSGTTTQSQSYAFRDEDLPFAADTVQYRLKQIDLDGTTSVSDPTVVERALEDNLSLKAPHPNPADQTATVQVQVPDGSGRAHLTLYNLLGQQVRRIPLSPSTQQTKSLTTTNLSSGTYILQLNAENTSPRTERLMVVH